MSQRRCQIESKGTTTLPQYFGHIKIMKHEFLRTFFIKKFIL